MKRYYKDYNQDLWVQVEKVFNETDKIFKQVHKIMDEVQQGPMSEIKEPWEKWFAWHPVTIKGKRRWLKTVYRRTKLKFGDPRIFREWEYGDIFDVIKGE